MNPRIGCGTQQAREPDGGGSRRGREERQGRNEHGAGRRPGRSGRKPAGVDSSRDADGGEVFEKPYGRRLARSEPGGCERRLRQRKMPARGGWCGPRSNPRAREAGHQDPVCSRTDLGSRSSPGKATRPGTSRGEVVLSHDRTLDRGWQENARRHVWDFGPRLIAPTREPSKGIS
jgi:hypothetical protein